MLREKENGTPLAEWYVRVSKTNDGVSSAGRKCVFSDDQQGSGRRKSFERNWRERKITCDKKKIRWQGGVSISWRFQKTGRGVGCKVAESGFAMENREAVHMGTRKTQIGLEWGRQAGGVKWPV